jgi:hypothetical protein
MIYISSAQTARKCLIVSQKRDRLRGFACDRCYGNCAVLEEKIFIFGGEITKYSSACYIPIGHWPRFFFPAPILINFVSGSEAMTWKPINFPDIPQPGFSSNLAGLLMKPWFIGILMNLLSV